MSQKIEFSKWGLGFQNWVWGLGFELFHWGFGSKFEQGELLCKELTRSMRVKLKQLVESKIVFTVDYQNLVTILLLFM